MWKLDFTAQIVLWNQCEVAGYNIAVDSWSNVYVETLAKLPVFALIVGSTFDFDFVKVFSPNFIEKVDISGMSWWFLSFLIVVNFIHCESISKIILV